MYVFSDLNDNKTGLEESVQISQAICKERTDRYTNTNSTLCGRNGTTYQY